MFVRCRDVVLTKKLWEHTQKTSHFETASNSFQRKALKRCGNAVPTFFRPPYSPGKMVHYLTIDYIEHSRIKIKQSNSTE